MVGILSIHLRLPGCASLKEKRGRLQPLIHRLQRKFNLSVAEMDRQDSWQEAVIACAMLGNHSAHLQSALGTVLNWVTANWTDGDLVDSNIEII